MITKDQIIKAMETLPEGATIEDALDRLYLLYKIERGLADVEAGRTVSQEEARRRASQWQL
ncbi:MAG: hypothetical protein HY689_10285 [Chloroflexi bacterium]|nr:hypothetical protein [Chloroflexota bacterium]